MFAGLPGTGVGGMFYLLLSLWMPFHELIRLFQGRSSVARWKMIARHWCLFAAVIGVIWGQTALLKALVPVSQQEQVHAAMQAKLEPVAPVATSTMVAASALMALVSLAAVVGVVYMLRMGVAVRKLIAA
jgi:hypothetical protein